MPQLKHQIIGDESPSVSLEYSLIASGFLGNYEMNLNDNDDDMRLRFQSINFAFS